MTRVPPLADVEQDDRATQRREQILDAAASLFARNGYSETDTQLLAETLGVGKGTLYRYFPSKRDLFLAVADRAMLKLREHIEASIASIVDPFKRIRCGLKAYLTFFAEHPDYVELLIQERALFKDRTKPTFFQHKEANAARWQGVYRELIADGEVRDIPPERITGVISDLLYGTMSNNYFAGARQSPEAQAEDIFDIVFHGLLTRRSSPERKE